MAGEEIGCLQRHFAFLSMHILLSLTSLKGWLEDINLCLLRNGCLSFSAKLLLHSAWCFSILRKRMHLLEASRSLQLFRTKFFHLKAAEACQLKASFLILCKLNYQQAFILFMQYGTAKVIMACYFKRLTAERALIQMLHSTPKELVLFCNNAWEIKRTKIVVILGSN